jgi:hypothetical protein
MTGEIPGRMSTGSGLTGPVLRVGEIVMSGACIARKVCGILLGLPTES